MNVNGLKIMQFELEKTNLRPAGNQEKLENLTNVSTKKQDNNESFSSTLNSVKQSKRRDTQVSNAPKGIKETENIESLKKELTIPKDKVVTEINQIKDKLKQAGASEEELNKINNLDDLKKLIDVKLMDGNVEDEDLASQLQSMMLTLNMAMNSISEKVSSIVNQVVGEELAAIKTTDSTGEINLDKVINLIEKIVTPEEGNNQLTKKLLENATKNGVVKAVESMLKQQSGDKISLDFLSKIQDSVQSSLVGKLEVKPLDIVKQNINTLNENIINPNTNIKLESVKTNTNIKLEGEKPNNDEITVAMTEKTVDKNAATPITANKEWQGNSLTSGEDDKDEKFLKVLSGEEKGDKISRATIFMNHMAPSSVASSNVEGEVAVINKATLNEDVVKTIKFMNLNGLKELTVKINPRELGEVVIKITMESGAMKANITANNKDAFNILNSNLESLTSKLQNNEIKIDNVSLNIYSEDTTFFKNGADSQQAEQQRREGQGSRQNGLEEISQEDLENFSEVDSNVNMLA